MTVYSLIVLASTTPLKMQFTTLVLALAASLVSAQNNVELPGQELYDRCMSGTIPSQPGTMQNCCDLMWNQCIYPTNSDLPHCQTYVQQFGCTPPL
jgi:hypothetical protein